MKRAYTARFTPSVGGRARCWSLALGLLLLGCGSYFYNGRQYASRDEAFDAQRVELERVVNAVVPLPAPLAKRARIGVPTRAVIYERLIFGNKAAGGRWLTDVLVREHDAVVRAIVRRRIFERV